MPENKTTFSGKPTVKETIWVTALTALFLLLQWLVVGLTPLHVALVGLFLILFFSCSTTRQLAMALLPFVIFAISYDWMRIYPNYRINPIDTRDLYDAELGLFGVMSEGKKVIPGEFFNNHNHPLADLMAGFFYLCWVPVPIAFALWLFLKRQREACLHFSLVFLFVNLIGFCGYYIHPAAPPWYVIQHGFTPDISTPGDVAGLCRFDALVGCPVFASIYTKNANIFAAVPSLHAAYMFIATIYAVRSRQPRWLITLFSFITLGIWCTAVYSCHHYIIDVLLGIATALVGIIIFECLLMRLPAFKRFINRYVRYVSMVAVLLLAVQVSQAQTTVTAEAQMTTSSGDHTPLWLNANKYGLSSLETTNGYFRAALTHSMDNDSLKKFAFAYGADVAVTSHFTSRLVVQQAYAEARWLKGVLTIGAKQQPLELRDQQLSSGSQTIGVNARPIPSVRLSLPDYWTVPYTRGVVAIKGFIAYGRQTDDRWQEDFTGRASKYTDNTMIHTKAGYLRIGKEDKPFTAELGLEVGCQYGGTAHVFNNGNEVTYQNQGGLKGMWQAFIPSGGDQGEGDYKNKGGNHVGSFLLRLNYDRPDYRIGLYADHFFEDISQMFFLDYDGYGKGENYNKWEDKHWFVYDCKDIMIGADLHLKKAHVVDAIVCEYVYSKHQSGPVYHDRTPSVSDHIAGIDNYYNHYIHTGWQHWGQVIGNPLYRSPLYNDNGEIKVADNRFVAWHIGFGGAPAKGLRYRILATWQQGLGTYENPFLAPAYNRSLLVEASYAPPTLKGWMAKAALGVDHGEILGNNTGFQLTVAKRICLK